MAKTPAKRGASPDGAAKPTTVRFTSEDVNKLEKLEKKLGLGVTQILRLAIRRLSEIEGL